MTATFKLATLGTAATLLAGCSWLPTGGGHKAPVAGSAYLGAQASASSCQIPHPQAPIPFGCNPASVTVGVAGFSQQPQFGPASQAPAAYATGGYGSHAAAGGAPYSVADVPFSEFERPLTPWGNGSRLRGTLSLGVSKSVGGDYLDYSSAGNINPSQGYDPSLYDVFDVRSVVQTELGVERFLASYTAEIESINQPNISYDDVHSTPLALKAGAEWAVSPRASVFGNVGYTYSEGQSGEAFNVTGAITRTRGEIREDTADSVIFTPGDVVTVPNVERIASFDFDFSDRRQLDLEAGGRYYFDYMGNRGLDRVRPFVSAAAGASMINEQNISISQTQSIYDAAFNNALTMSPSEATQGTLYNVVPAQLGGQSANVRLYDEQWVPSGRLNAGVEWQASPRTSLAFETGVEVRGGLEYATTGERGDSDIAIPVTVRGSFNF